MRERLVRLRHLEHVLLLFEGSTLVGGSIKQFHREALGHRDAFARARGIEDPADGKRRLALGSDFHRHLIDRPGNALGADFDERRHIEKSLAEDLQRRILCAGLDDLHGIPENATRDGLLALAHQTADELLDLRIGTFGDVRFDRLGHGKFGLRSDEEELSGFRLLGAVAGATLLAVAHTFGVEDAADDVVADTREIFDASSADKHHRVFLQVVALSHDVGLHFVTVGQAYAGDFTESRVRLLRRHRRDFNADAALEGRALGKAEPHAS